MTEISENSLIDKLEGISGIGSWHFDFSSKLLRWSKRTYSIYGVSPDLYSPDTTTIHEIYHAEDKKRVQDALILAIENHEDVEFEGRILKKNESICWIRVKGVCDENGLLGIVEDITEYKTFKQQSLENEERYELAVKGSSVGLWDLNVRTGDLYWSPRFKEIVGIENEDFIPHLTSFSDRLHPDDFDRIMGSLQDHIEKKSPYDVEYQLRREDGSYVWIHARGQAVWDEMGNPLRMAGSVDDIQKTKENEALLQSKSNLLEGLGSIQLQFLSEQHPAKAFDRMLAILLETANSEYGFIGEVLRKEDDTPYLKTHAITNIAWNDQTRSFYENHAPSGLEFFNLNTLFGTVLTTEEPVIANDPGHDPRAGGLPEGHPHMGSFLGLPFFHSNELIGMVGVANRPEGYDEELIELLEPILATCSSMVHAYRLKKMREAQEEELRISRDEAFVASKVKSDFLATMSHEMRTPLNGVIGMASLLVDTELDEEQEEYLQIINTSAQSLLTVINDVLEFSRLESGSIQFELAPFNTLSCLEDTLDVMSMEAFRKGIDLASYIAPDVPLSVLGDLHRIRQVLLNLISNAVKFTHEGGVVVTLEAEQEETEDDVEVCRLIFTITDTGIGIDAHQLESIFDSFTQADTSITRKYGGTGLGLTISKQIVHLMDGSITVESVPGEGSSFQFSARVPVLLNYLTVKTRLFSSLVEVDRIILITDREKTREVLGKQLTSFDLAVIPVSGTKNARDVLQQIPSTDVIIIEYDSLQNNTELKEYLSDRHFPCIVLTDLNAEDITLSGDYIRLQKPVKCMKLIQGLRMAQSESRELNASE